MFFLLSSLCFAEVNTCPWLSLWKSPPQVELQNGQLTLSGSLEIPLQTTKAQSRFLHELELCRANGDVVQTYTEWMNDNQPQLKNVRLASLGLGILGMGVGIGVWNTNQSLGQPAVILGGVTSIFSATTFWIDRPTPMIEQAFVESFAQYLEQRHLDAMEWMDEILAHEQNCFKARSDKRGELHIQQKSCEQSMFLVKNSNYPGMNGVYSETQIHEQLENLKQESVRLDLRERQDRALYYCKARGRFADAESAELALTDMLWLLENTEGLSSEIPDSCHTKIKAARSMLK